MKKSNLLIISAVLFSLVTANAAHAYWLWTPDTKKFVNPKYAVKDSPKEQYEWAMSFYDAKDYQRAAAEFEKLTKNYEYSEYAARSQYRAGLCYENMGKFYIAFQNYQKTIDNFPHIENMDEIIAREFNIANIYAVKENPKVLGTDIMTSMERAIEIYRKVIDNSPYGKLADEAQFKLGMALKKVERYDEAMAAFQKIVDDYQSSRFAEEAKYEVASCAYKSSLKPDYDIESTSKAIRAFEEFSHESSQNDLSREASSTIQRLKDRSAEKSMSVAKFYESQRHYESAIIYYRDVVDRFPDSAHINTATAKIEELKMKGKK